MKVIAAKEEITALDLDVINRFPHRSSQLVDRGACAEGELKSLILAGQNGKTVLKFSIELCSVLVRNGLVENDASELHRKVCSGLVQTLACSINEAHCLVDLSLELIHAKVHQEIRRSDEDLAYLISRGGRALICDFATV